MTYWTILVIFLLDGASLRFGYRDPMACGTALLSIANDSAVEWAQCAMTNVPSATIRPKRRPGPNV